MDRPYRAVRAIARFWIWFFFRSIEVRHPERVPERGRSCSPSTIPTI
jgi:1-acyl-sn-glycerol-3-phosphate acyltransferase